MFIRPLYWCDIYKYMMIYAFPFFVFEVNDMYITLIIPLLTTAMITLNNDLLWLMVIYHSLPYYIFHAKWPKKDLWRIMLVAHNWTQLVIWWIVIGKCVFLHGPLAHFCQSQLAMWLVVTQNCAQFYSTSIIHLWKNRWKRQYKPILNDIVFSSKTIQTHPKWYERLDG